MGIIGFLLWSGLLTGAPEQAAPPMLDLSAHFEMGSHLPGGRRVGSGGSKPIIQGQSVKIKVYSGDNSCGFVEGSGAPPTSGVRLPSGAPAFLGTPYEQPLRGASKTEPRRALGWQVDATPVEITPDHVRLRVRWAREIQVGNSAGKGAEDIVVLLRPGDAMPLERVSIPDVRNNCNNSMGLLVLSVTARDPGRAKVASTDLWLVHKHPGGKETTQHINVRSELNSPVPFFFDEERVGTAVLDVFGRLTLRPTAGDSLALEFSAQRVLAGEQYGVNSSHFGSGIAGQMILSNSLAFGSNGGGQMVLEIGPDSVTEFEIPQGSGPGWAAFAGHTLSVRVKSRRMR